MKYPIAVYRDALRGLLIQEKTANPAKEIQGVTNNSAHVAEGFLFCAIEGSKTDGHDFIPAAVAAGASVIVASKPVELPPGVSLLRVSDSYQAWGILCAVFHGNPAESLDLFAVTGTNGKTSIAFMLKKLLSAAGFRCGLVSTVEYDDGGATPPEEAARTTPEAGALQELFARMKQNQCQCAVMEASSHGLHQHRMGKIQYAGAIFTNLTGDHLDYHHTMEAYYQAKKLLFSEMLRPGAPAIINTDDEWGKRMSSELTDARVLTLSANDPTASVRILDFRLSESGTDFTLSINGDVMKIRSKLIGEHNIYNMALAAAAAYDYGIAPAVIEQVLSSAGIAPPGRLEPLELPNGAHAFVDYAHTDDALFRVLSAIRAFCKGNIITVFGCGGDRDRTKRPRMAAAASGLSDITIVTSDNPRSEDPDAIIREILPGIQPKARYFAEPDRRKAIRLAVNLSSRGDVILIAGKGHENYQEIRGVKHHFDDREILRELGGH